MFNFATMELKFVNSEGTVLTLPAIYGKGGKLQNLLSRGYKLQEQKPIELQEVKDVEEVETKDEPFPATDEQIEVEQPKRRGRKPKA